MMSLKVHCDCCRLDERDVIECSRYREWYNRECCNVKMPSTSKSERTLNGLACAVNNILA